VVRFLKASGEIMSGYSTAMSLPSSAVDFMAAVLEVEVPETGELTFSCGMGMYRGALVAR
jgi:plastocyanin domain-containing protein